MVSIRWRSGGRTGVAVCATLTVFSLAAHGTTAGAATLTTGRAYVSFDLDAFAEWGLRLDSFIGAEGNPLPVGPVAGEDLLDTEVGEFTSPQVHTLNPPGVDVTPSEPRRKAPPTGFTYDVATLPTSASGSIAVAGVSRWRVDPAAGGGTLLLGDYALAWNAAASRWELRTYIDYTVVAFTLADVELRAGPGDAFSVSGELLGSSSLGLLMPGATGRRFGHFAFSTAETACADGLDNDRDGLVDLADPGCTDPDDPSERGEGACDDGDDDDGDGRIDFHPDLDGDGLADSPGDLGCASPSSATESPACQDGIDNDGQPGIDWDGGQSAGVSDPGGPDPQCTSPRRSTEAPSSCGLGVELALLLPLLRAARRVRLTRA